MNSSRDDKEGVTNKNGSDNDEDAFWAVALMGGTQQEFLPGDGSEGDNDDANDENDEEINVSLYARLDQYTIPNSNGVTLTLRPLPCSDGIWGPLGAETWYVCIYG